MTGISGDIKQATKITLSPHAVEILYKLSSNSDLRWPELGSNDFLFTYSQLEHDKVNEIELPLHGVWLHRDHNLVVEYPITADEKVMNVHSGHGYNFVGGAIKRQDITDSCKCGHPEYHDRRVQAMLSLSLALEKECLVMLPHPKRIPNWYFVL